MLENKLEIAIHRRLNLINGEYLTIDELLEETKGMAKEVRDIVKEEIWHDVLNPPKSFGEEDKKMIDYIISDLRELRDNETNEELISDYEREIEWLKEKI